MIKSTKTVNSFILQHKMRLHKNPGIRVTWPFVKRMRIQVQHLLCYERVEMCKSQSKNIIRFTDSLLDICKKGPISENERDVALFENRRPLPTLDALPPKTITTNHIVPHDSMNYSPENFSFKLGAEHWAYDHVFDSDRRFGKTTKDRDQSIEQYTRDMLDWWTEGENQEILQDKIYNCFLPRYEKLLGRNRNNYCNVANLGKIYLETRRKTDFFPAFRAGASTGGRFNAGLTGGFDGAGPSMQCIVELQGHPWPPLPTIYEGNQQENTYQNVMLNAALGKNGEHRKGFIPKYKRLNTDDRGRTDSGSNTIY